MMRLFAVSLLAGLGLILAASNVAVANSAHPAKVDKTKVGQVEIYLVPPEGLERVSGPDADAFIAKIEPKLKIKVLAIYAGSAQWPTFVQALKNKQPVAIPRLALICIPQKMLKKSFKLEKLLEEHRKYSELFNWVANNVTLIPVLSSKANENLEKIMETKLDFKIKYDESTQKFATGHKYISIGTGVSLNVFGQTSTIYFTTTSQAIDDKMIFLGYGDTMSSQEVVKSIQTQALNWRQALVDAQATSSSPSPSPNPSPNPS